ncbi:redoxin family protein [Seleniivibrio sp.]|uniref:TlpA family protein disulfide reductase n=1 Tax=Seleniivibrio sp. TaxID=2898801 RepID=UPI0025D24ED5|nr:redoxin family protein [Seleniivibrio sp.]MCD8554836.1 redoxin family protein [Seleniivibrio sp.]
MRKIFFITLLVLLTAQLFAAPLKTVEAEDIVRMSKSFNGKTVVVFWAPWCPHCMREMRMLRNSPEFIKKNNIQIIGITKPADERYAESTIKEEKFPFKFFTGSIALHKELMKIDAVPFTKVYNSKGEVSDEEYGSQTLEDIEVMLN